MGVIEDRARELAAAVTLMISRAPARMIPEVTPEQSKVTSRQKKINKKVLEDRIIFEHIPN